jgi:hypothetical protein
MRQDSMPEKKPSTMSITCTVAEAKRQGAAKSFPLAGRVVDQFARLHSFHRHGRTASHIFAASTMTWMAATRAAMTERT